MANPIENDSSSKENKRVVLNRHLSMNFERVPLTAFPKYKTASPTLLGKWKHRREATWESKNTVLTVTEESEQSDDDHCINCGESPPPEDDMLFSSLENVTEEISVRICRESLTAGLLEYMKSNGGNVHHLENIESGKLSGEDVAIAFKKCMKTERNIAFLWAAFLKKRDILENIFELGVDIHFSEPNEGFTALHLAAFTGCVSCAQFLISNGANVNIAPKWFTPLHSAAFGNSFEVTKLLFKNGAKLETVGKVKSNESFIYGTALHSAVKANAIECVQLLIEKCCDVNSIEPGGVSPLHVAAELGHYQCLKILLENGINPNLTTRSKRNTALHLASENGFSECISLLLMQGANVDVRNYKGQAPLHLAARAQSLECVEVLLNAGKCDPNVLDSDERTPLHSAIRKSYLAFEIIEVLISWRAEVNQKDKYGYTPLHVAALNEQSQCVETLIFHGADVTARTKGGTTALNIILRKTPVSLGIVYQKFDSALTLNYPEAPNREACLKLDFRHLLQHCNIGEIKFLKTFVDEGQKEILQHPLCESFLYLKWEKIRKYYIARLVFCAIFVLCLTCYVLTALAHNCYNTGKAMAENSIEMNNGTRGELCLNKSMVGAFLRRNPFIIELEWFILVICTLFEMFRKSVGFAAYSSLKQYLCQLENVIEWFVIASVFIISCIYTGRTYTWQNHIGAFAVLFSWVNLMIMIGQLPVLGSYVAMYTSVQKEFAKLFTAYACLLIGFTISFCVIFPELEAFSNPFVGFIKVLVMMTGELEFEDLLLGDKNEEKGPAVVLEVSAHITFVIFLLFVTIILMNLLVGIAVHDIQGLQKTAGLSKLVRQTNLIAYIESALFDGFLPRYVIQLLEWTALVSPSAYKVVMQVKPLNPRENRLPKHVMRAAYEIAKQRKRFGHTVSSRGSVSTTTTGVSKFQYLRQLSFGDQKQNTLIPNSDAANMQNLCLGIEDNTKEIVQLKGDVMELKEMLKLNQIMINQLLEIVNKKSSDC